MDAKECIHVIQITEYENDPDDKCGLQKSLFCWGLDALHCPLNQKERSAE